MARFATSISSIEGVGSLWRKSSCLMANSPPPMIPDPVILAWPMGTIGLLGLDGKDGVEGGVGGVEPLLGAGEEPPRGAIGVAQFSDHRLAGTAALRALPLLVQKQRLLIALAQVGP